MIYPVSSVNNKKEGKKEEETITNFFLKNKKTYLLKMQSVDFIWILTWTNQMEKDMYWTLGGYLRWGEKESLLLVVRGNGTMAVLKKKKKKNSCHLEIHVEIFRDDMMSGVCFKIIKCR